MSWGECLFLNATSLVNNMIAFKLLKLPVVRHQQIILISPTDVLQLLYSNARNGKKCQ